jgi:hypothetical protein
MTAKTKPGWKRVEENVRELATYIWGSQAEPQHVGGVDVDAVVKLHPGYWIVVETTQEETLDKVRTDIAKFAVVRLALTAQGIASTCYFITEFPPTPAMKEAAEAQHIVAIGMEDLRRMFFDFATYRTARANRPFGSAIDAESGAVDKTDYVPVKYQRLDSGVNIELADIAKELYANKKIILLGEFGTGKSRCFQELFRVMAENAQVQSTLTYPIAIDLRDNWGLKRATEIIRRHFDDLGLSNLSDPAIKAYNGGSVCFFLDGFDEIGSQSWGDSPEKLKDVRHQATQGVRDLLSRITAGAIVSGREHYFNTAEEMYEALGLDPAKTLTVRCKNDFTPEEMQRFLAKVAADLALPPWLPRRPLICRAIASLETEQLDDMFAEDGGDVAFWNVLIDTICTREARIRSILDPDKIKNILRLIARATRNKPQNVGPVSATEINHAFEMVVGGRPVDESAAILARLPGLGRVAAETSERRFIDMYILDGLRGLDVDYCVTTYTDGAENETWMNPLELLGQSVTADALQRRSEAPHSVLTDAHLRLAREAISHGNTILAGDIIASLLRVPALGPELDFGDLELKNSHIHVLDCSNVIPKNLNVRETIIQELVIPPAEPPGTRLEKCLIDVIHNISSSKGVPNWISTCEIKKFEAVGTVAQIKTARLSPKQRIFLAMVKKTFFQPGAGRKEAALLRGLGRLGDRSVRDEVLNLLLGQKILERFRGDEGDVYAPVRAYTHRMQTIVSELTQSKDPLWLEISKP